MENDREAEDHDSDLCGESKDEAEVLAEEELPPGHGLTGNGVDRLTLNLFIDEPDADEDCDHQAEDGDQ